MRAIAYLLVAACSHQGAAPPAQPPTEHHVPDVRIAVTSGGTVRIVRLADSGLLLERIVDASSSNHAAARRPLPAVAAPTDPRVEIVDRDVKLEKLRENPLYIDLDDEAPPPSRPENLRKIVRCTERGHAAVEYPPLEGDANENHDTLTWLSADPPVFQVTERGAGARVIVFERCAPSRRYTGVVVGPQELVVLLGGELSVLWHGREVGHLATRADAVEFR